MDITVFLTDMAHYQGMNEVYNSYFRPVRFRTYAPFFLRVPFVIYPVGNRAHPHDGRGEAAASPEPAHRTEGRCCGAEARLSASVVSGNNNKAVGTSVCAASAPVVTHTHTHAHILSQFRITTAKLQFRLKYMCTSSSYAYEDTPLLPAAEQQCLILNVLLLYYASEV